MYELIKLTENNYYIESPARIGIVAFGNNAIIIDSGNDKDAGKKIKKILDGIGSTVKSYLTWLKENERVVAEIEGNNMIWRRTL